MNKRVDITIFIPTYFAEDTLAHLLRKIFKQKIDKTFEVLIYDTSSTDKTPKIIKKYAKNTQTCGIKPSQKRNMVTVRREQLPLTMQKVTLLFICHKTLRPLISIGYMR